MHVASPDALSFVVSTPTVVAVGSSVARGVSWHGDVLDDCLHTPTARPSAYLQHP
jgi:hypothetical protein